MTASRKITTHFHTQYFGRTGVRPTQMTCTNNIELQILCPNIYR